MNAKELRSLSPDELKTRLKEFQESLFTFRFQHGIKELDNTAKLGRTKRDIAKVRTVMRELESREL